jgi:hypothetical protein
MKPDRILLSVMMASWLMVFFSLSFAQQTPKPAPRPMKAVDGKAAAETAAPNKSRPIKMELIQRGDRVYLKLDRAAKGVWLDKRQKGIKSLGTGLLIEVTSCLPKARGGKLTFAVLDAMDRMHTKTLPVHPFASSLKPPAPGTTDKGATAKRDSGALNEARQEAPPGAGMTAPLPRALETAAGRFQPSPGDRLAGPAATSAEQMRERAEEGEGLAPVSGLAQTHAPRRPQSPPQIEEIVQGIVIEAPAAGTRVRAGERVTVRWEYEERVFEEYSDRPMSVDLYARSVEDPSAIVWTFRAGSDREIDWSIPSDTAAGLYIIEARFDSGSTVFTGSTHIEVLPSSELVLLWPPEINPGGTTLYVGYEYPITWDAYGDADGRPLDIQLMDGDALFETVASGITRSSERYEWRVGGNCNTSAMVPRGDNYRIRIATAGGPTFEDVSAPITIRLPTLALDVRPRSGERWHIGDSYAIIWNSDHVPDGATVKLSLYKGGAYYLLIDENQPNTGSYLWAEAGVEKYLGPITNASTAQAQAVPDDDYSIRIEMEDCDLVYGLSPVFELY